MADLRGILNQEVLLILQRIPSKGQRQKINNMKSSQVEIMSSKWGALIWEWR